MVASRLARPSSRAAKDRVKWLADENFRHAILRGLWRRSPGIDIVRVQDLTNLSGAEDVVILAWATAEGRIVLTHDMSTMIPAIREQNRRTQKCSPVVLVSDSLPTSAVIEDILLLDQCALEGDWSSGILYLPLR
jgi:hypothetical protein